MNGLQHAELALAREAAEWLDHLDEQDTQSRAAFTEWVTKSPLHIKAFLNLTAVDRLLEGVDSNREIDVERLIASSRSNVVPLAQSKQAHGVEQRSTPTRKVWRTVTGVAAAVAVVVIGGLWAWATLFGGPAYVAARGEPRTVNLDDGSVVDLNTGSRIEVHYSARRREIFLDGEAMFTVHKDLARPFRVHGGDTLVQAIGTQFNVQQRPSSTIVSVVEGAVRIAAHPSEPTAPAAIESDRFAAGEEAVVRREGRIERRPLARTVGMPAWREQRLVFEDDRLEDIAAEFNRWNRAQIRIEGDALGARLYTGAFNAQDPQSLIAFLREDPAVQVDARADELVIRARR